MKVYFTRHSTTIWNQEHRLQGWKDSSLTIEGINDAKRLKERIQDIPFDSCYTSPLKRAMDTTNILFDDIPIHIEERLKELNFGDFEGQKISAIKEEPIYYNLWHHPTANLQLPNGESLQEVFHRVEDCLQSIYQKHPTDTIFLTTHGMICIVILTIIHSLSIEEMTKMNTVMRGCALHCFQFDGTHYQLEFMNDDSHLATLKEPIIYHK